jgi:plastocyanin
MDDQYSSHMNGKTVGIIIGIIVLALLGWMLIGKKDAGEPQTAVQEPVVEQDAGPTITYSDQGFTPANVTVEVGTPVTFVNESSKKMWVASAVHPSHSVYSGTTREQHCPDATGTAFDQCSGGEQGTSYTFTFTKEGTWKYHDHIDASKFGSITVIPQQ